MRLPCLSLYPGVWSNSYPVNPWCHPTISSSVIPYSSCPQSFPGSGAFPVSQLFTSDGQSTRASASASVLPVNIQDWFPLGWTGLISLLPKGLSRRRQRHPLQCPCLETLWTEEPAGPQSMGSQRVGHDWATSLSLFTFTHWRRKWQPTPVFLPGESQGRGSLWAAVYGVAQSQPRLKRPSSSSTKGLARVFSSTAVPKH